MNKASLPFLSLGGWSQRPADVAEVAHSSTPRHRSQGENPPLGLTLGGQWTGEDGFRPCPRAQASRTWQGGGAGRGEGWFPFRLVFWLSSEARDCSGLLPQGHSSSYKSKFSDCTPGTLGLGPACCLYKPFQ